MRDGCASMGRCHDRLHAMYGRLLRSQATLKRLERMEQLRRIVLVALGVALMGG